MAAIALERLSGSAADDADLGVTSVDLSIAEGEWLVLAGPAGSGKSTLLDLIAGTRAPASGRVLIGGCDVTEELGAQRGLTVLRQVAVQAPREARGKPSFEWMWRRLPPPAPPPAPSLLEQFRAALLDTGSDRVPVLADDPLSRLDPAEVPAMRVDLAACHAARPRVVVHATRNQEDALALGHRVAVIFDGAIAQVGPPLLVYERPANLAVARFFGTPAINLFDGSVLVRDGVPVFDAAGQTLAELPPSAAPLAGRPMMLGVRPQDIEVARDGCGVVGITQAVEPIGPSQFVHVGLPGWLSLVAVVPSRPLLVAGSRRCFRLRSDRLHLFNEDGERYVGLDGAA